MLNTLPDIELWALIQQGDAHAFEALYNRYWEKLYTLCYWHLMNRENARDVVQELFVELWVKRERILISKTVEGYLKIAARNRVCSYLRNANREVKNKALQNIAKTAPSSTQQDHAGELRQLYHREIQKLSQRKKTVYTLVHEQGFSIREVAEKLSLPEQSVKNSLSEARKSIREALEYYKFMMVLICIQALPYFLCSSTVLIVIFFVFVNRISNDTTQQYLLWLQ